MRRSRPLPLANPTRLPLAALVAFVTWWPAPVIAAAAADEPATEVRSPTSDQVDAVVARWMESTGIPGSSVAIVRGGQTIHLAGYGRADADGRPVTPDTPFLIGSVSKPFTAAAVFRLVQEGRLGLHEPIGPHLDAAVEGDTTAFDGVTLEHLLMHTSGFPMSLGLPGTAPARAGADALELRVTDLVEQHTPSRRPGQQYEYSNANYILLAWAIERVSGVPFAEYVEDHVFGPLGMVSSFASDGHPRASDLATGHESWFGRWSASNQPYDPAGTAMGYMGSTGRDLAAFLHAQLDDEPTDVLPVRAADVLDRPAVPTEWDVPLERYIADGWFVDRVGDHRTVSHAGSLGNYTAHVIMVPDAGGLGIAVAQNASAFVAAGHDGQYGLSLELLELMLGLEPDERGFSPLLTVVAPAVAWGIAIVIGASAVRTMARRLGNRHVRHHVDWRKRVARRLLPAAAYVLFALMVLIAVPPLAGGTWGSAQLFYPDVAWGLLVAGYLALGWGVARAVMEFVEARG